MNARREFLRRRLDGTGSARRGIRPRPDPETAPLSAAQHRMWLHQRLHPASSAYNVCIRMDFDGELDEGRLRRALAALVDRHEVLRTTYPADTEGRPSQRIHRSLPPPIHVLDEPDPGRVAARAAAEPFDLAGAGPIRFHLVRREPARCSLVLSVHHIVWDGGCFGVLSRDLGLAYRGLDPAPLAIQYADIAAHDARPDAAASARIEAQLAHWRRVLSPPPPVPKLPCERPQGPGIGERARRADRTMTRACATGLRTLAAALGTTPFTVMIAAYALLLRRWTGGSDIVIGTMVADRHRPGTRDLIGNFGNTVLLRLDLSGEPTFADLAARAARVVRDALGNADIAFERVVEELAPPREPGHGVFTDTLGLFLDRDIEGPDLPGVDARWDNVFNAASPFALTFQGFLTGGALTVEATYRDAFAPATVQGMLAHLEAILLAAAADPARPCSLVGELPCEHADRLVRLAAGHEHGDEAGLSPETVPECWRRRVEATPDSPALVCGSERFSCAEIGARADRLAARLVAAGVRAGDVVGVVLRRGPTTMVAPLAIWACGAVYLPLDRDYPAARLHDLLAEAGARLVLCEPGFEAGPVPALVAEGVDAPVGPSAFDPGYRPHPWDAAHVTFTSGSTGRPKGVVTTHASLAARTSWVAALWPGGRGGARLGRSVPTAIDATAELCEAIVTGETLVLAGDEAARDAVAIADLLRRHRIGHLMSVPGLLEAVTVAAPEVIAGCDRVLATGEPLLPSVARAIHAAAPGVRLHNAYGCSETTGDVVAGPVEAADAGGEAVPIGRPLPGSRCYVLMADLALAPQGVLGELYVEGPQLARGYLAQPAATAERFVANPFRAGARLYRTGDLVRWRPDGRLDLLGRSDDQVNVRGHRVETAETVAALHALPRVREAAVLPRSAGPTTELVAYVAGDDLRPDDAPALRQGLACRLPGPLVPSRIVVLPGLPRLAGGKIDRRILAQTVDVREAPSRQPRDARETALARLLGDLLGREAVGIDDDFFEIGGDSLLALTFAARAGAAGLAFPAAAVFRYPTIARLTEQLPAQTEAPAASLPLPPQIHRFRLSDIPVADFVTWHALAEPAAPDRLRRVLADAVARHASLRQALAARGRLWRSRPAAARDGNPGDRAAVIEVPRLDIARAIEAARPALDLAAGRTLVAVAAPEAALLVAHPVAVDGLSLARIAREIEAGLRGDGLPPAPAEAADMPSARSHWDAILQAGPGCPWWIGPDEAVQAGPCAHVSGSADAAGEAQVADAFLHALRRVSGADLVVADIEVAPDTIGPLCAVPVAGRSGMPAILGDWRSYAIDLADRRPIAGGAGVLLRRTVCLGAPPPDAPARGADRLYRVAAAWQPSGGRIALDVAAATAGTAESLAAAWMAALRGPGR